MTQGETLYGISRKYEIPIQTVIEDNPNLDPVHLRLGERILIRKKEIGSEDEAGTREQWEAYRNSLNSVAEEGFAYHIVKPGETFYSLSRRFGITEDRLGTLNGGLKPADLKAGAIIKVPGSAEQLAAAENGPQADSLQVQDSLPGIFAGSRPKQVEFRALRRSAPLKVALMLPMAVGNEPNGNYLEFYQGFLLGLDSVRTKYGHSIDLTLYNTARNVDAIREFVKSDAFAGTGLIVGPVYEEGLHPVILYAEGARRPRRLAAGQHHGDEQRRPVPNGTRPVAQMGQGRRLGERGQTGDADLQRQHGQGLRIRDPRPAGRFRLPEVHLYICAPVEPFLQQSGRPDAAAG